MVAPVLEVRRKRYPDMGPTRGGHGSVDHGPSTTDATRQQRGVLVLGRHDVAQPFAGDVTEQARQLVQHLEQHYTEEVLETLIRASGIDENRGLEN